MTFSEGQDIITSKLSNTSLLPVVLLILVSTAVYLNTLTHDFVFDDMGTIVENKYISELGNNFPSFFTKDYFKIAGSEASYRPVATLSYFLIYAISELNPFTYHLSSLLFHIINVLLVYALVNLIQKNKITSLIAGLLFATHPVLSETVNCVSFNEDLLTTLFFLISLIFYIKIRANSKTLRIPLFGLSLLAFLLALLSKEMAITLPGIILLYDLTFADPENEKLSWKRSITTIRSKIFYYFGFMAATLFYLFLRFHVFYNQKELSVHSHGSLFDRIIFLPKHIVDYLQIVLFPLNLNADYVFSYPNSYFAISNIIAFLIMAGLVVISFFILKKSREIFFGIWWFLITLFPVSNIIQIFNPLADRYLYLPLIGFCLALSIFINSILHRILAPRINKFTVLKVLSVAAILIFYSSVTISRNYDWKDNFTLFSKTLESSPNSPIAHGGLGTAYQQQGKYDEATREFKKTVELMPRHYKAHYSLAYLYEMQGFVEQAIYHYEKVVEINPNFVDAYYNLANIFTKYRLLAQAAHAYEKVIKLEPNDYEARNNLGVVYAMQGKLGQAIQVWEKVLEIDPQNQNASENIEKARKVIN